MYTVQLLMVLVEAPPPSLSPRRKHSTYNLAPPTSTSPHHTPRTKPPFLKLFSEAFKPPQAPLSAVPTKRSTPMPSDLYLHPAP